MRRSSRGTWAAWLGCAFALACAEAFGAPPAQPAADGASLPILVYHQIGEPDRPGNAPITVSLQDFERQMQYLHEHGYATLTTSETVEFVRTGRAPSDRIVAIHFDDGWKSSLAALPILDRYGFAATYWIIPGTGIGEPHMGWDDIEKLAAHPHIEVESHTWSHPWKDGQTLVDWVEGRTAGRSAEQARWELVQSRRSLEEHLRRPVRYLAWPRGLYDDALIELARQAGYLALFTTDGGTNQSGQDPMRMRRTMIDGACDLRAFERILADGVYRDCSEPQPAGVQQKAGN